MFFIYGYLLHVYLCVGISALHDHVTDGQAGSASTKVVGADRV